MERNGNGNGHPATFTTMRLDLATKLSLMAAWIFGCQYEGGGRAEANRIARDAVDAAVEIHKASDIAAERLKEQWKAANQSR